MARQRNRAQQVRIIGGKWKGRKLRFQGGADLRPTLGRVRETLFNWLRPEIADMRCLDAFAGSGILGFEALSQGAAEVVFVEQQMKTVQSLQASARELGAQSRATIVRADLRSYLHRATAPFDLVFLDPPFAQSELLAQVLSALVQHGLVRHYVYAEGPSLERLENTLTAAGLTLERRTRAGDTAAVLASMNPERR